MNINALPETGFIRLKEILELYPVSRSQWWALVKAGRLPQPVKLSERVTAWRCEDIRALLASYGPAANDGSAQA